MGILLLSLKPLRFLFQNYLLAAYDVNAALHLLQALACEVVNNRVVALGEGWGDALDCIGNSILHVHVVIVDKGPLTTLLFAKDDAFITVLTSGIASLFLIF